MNEEWNRNRQCAYRRQTKNGNENFLMGHICRSGLKSAKSLKFRISCFRAKQFPLIKGTFSKLSLRDVVVENASISETGDLGDDEILQVE